jgi:hypothetical protein
MKTLVWLGLLALIGVGGYYGYKMAKGEGGWLSSCGGWSGGQPIRGRRTRRRPRPRSRPTRAPRRARQAEPGAGQPAHEGVRGAAGRTACRPPRSSQAPTLTAWA